jgi:malate dehydrogenase (oxaloacetate-decarboxylating)
VAVQAVKEGVARAPLSWDDVYRRALDDIKAARDLVDEMQEKGYITEPPREIPEAALAKAIAQVRS